MKYIIGLLTKLVKFYHVNRIEKVASNPGESLTLGNISVWQYSPVLYCVNSVQKRGVAIFIEIDYI